MNTKQFATRLTVATVALTLAGMFSSRTFAEEHTHDNAKATGGKKAVNALIQAVRDNTERFKDVAMAESEQYFEQFGCVSGPDAGAMGIHYVNFPLVIDGQIEVTKPEIVIYEPTSNGGLTLIGADYLVLKSQWDQSHPDGVAPELMGQYFHLIEEPNRFRLPAFYTLHVWAWKDSPTGAFVNWHTGVSCDAFAKQD